MTSVLKELEPEFLALGETERRTAVQLSEGHLIGFVRKVYNRMIDVDAALRGRGHAASVSRYSPSVEIQKAEEWIGERMRALLQTGNAPALKETPTSANKQPELIVIKPTFMGMSIDLKEVWRRLRNKLQR